MNDAPGRPIEVQIERLALDGQGIAHIGGREVRVPGVIDGERVAVSVAGDRAEVLSLVDPSPHRVTPGCRHFGPCGGCAWQHIAYAEQLRIKQRLLEALLAQAMGQKRPVVAPTIPSPGGGPARPAAPGQDPDAPWGFRNKVSFVFASDGRRVAVGHYRSGSHAVLPVEECPVHAPQGNAAAFALCDALTRAGVRAAGERLAGLARHVVARVSHRTGEVLLTLVATRNDKRLRETTRLLLAADVRLDGFHLNIHDRPGPWLFGDQTLKITGRDRLREELGGVSFLVSPASFFQTNVGAAERLVEHMLALVPDIPESPVLDLYAGAGLFALPLARRGHRVLAIEENQKAVADGDASRDLNHLSERRCRFVRARVETMLAKFDRQGQETFQAVVMDPPRQGCPAPVLEALFARLAPPRVVYVSCNPEALAADLAQAARAGYEVESIQPIDMFPHTPHIETVASLTRKRN